MKKRKLKAAIIICFIVIVFVIIGLLFSNFAKKRIEKILYPREYIEQVDKYAKKYDLESARVFAVINCESSFDPNAISSAGAIGLMQIMPSTYEWICEKGIVEYKDDALFDPNVNIECGCWYLKFLYDYYGDWSLAHAAYNAGPGNVNKWCEQEKNLEAIPNDGVKEYVKNILKKYKKYIEIYNGGNYNE